MSDLINSVYYKMWVRKVAFSQYRYSMIESIAIDETCEGSDTCTLIVNDPEFYFIGDKYFVEKGSIKLEFGFYGETFHYTFDGYISAIDITFGESGVPQLTVYCTDKSNLLDRTKRTREWKNVSNVYVIKKIADAYGLKCVVEKDYTFKKQESITQDDVTDIELCESLAQSELSLFLCKVKNGAIYYIKKGIFTEPKATVDYRGGNHDVISFTPKINVESRSPQSSSDDSGGGGSPDGGLYDGGGDPEETPTLAESNAIHEAAFVKAHNNYANYASGRLYPVSSITSPVTHGTTTYTQANEAFMTCVAYKKMAPTMYKLPPDTPSHYYTENYWKSVLELQSKIIKYNEGIIKNKFDAGYYFDNYSKTWKLRTSSTTTTTGGRTYNTTFRETTR